MNTETYEVWLLRSGAFHFWTGRKWDLRPYNAKCYAVKKEAEKYLAVASRNAEEKVEIVQGTLTVPVG